ncbi:hypothetical protein Mgra_00000189 [Meloidogyne graminicola]|uniref:Uncharacterized protein n=1 Tax=Meloidogyne graminicola TaxID=189291 RepID=A0A8T0A4R5_9BILA|nr:hypothetical protein Mgra_00000189 [Meloidogyne graminicola]
MSEAKKIDSQPLLSSSASLLCSPDDDSKTKSKYHFEVAILALVTMVLAAFILQALANCEFFYACLAVLPIVLFLTFFGYEWVTYFSYALTRRRRAYFDVRNLFGTYQPRKSTDLARQFKPDPPTPSASNQSTTEGIRFPEEDIGGGDKESGSEKGVAWWNEHHPDIYAKATIMVYRWFFVHEPIWTIEELFES